MSRLHTRPSPERALQVPVATSSFALSGLAFNIVHFPRALPGAEEFEPSRLSAAWNSQRTQPLRGCGTRAAARADDGRAAVVVGVKAPGLMLESQLRRGGRRSSAMMPTASPDPGEPGPGLPLRLSAFACASAQAQRLRRKAAPASPARGLCRRSRRWGSCRRRRRRLLPSRSYLPARPGRARPP